ncbi:MAG: hypothetical protein Q7J86_10010 [Bacteroidota bacterium]|nr:hypothetical protein [Bacteroidota bacterium]MDO9614843.1 hypothetical protein [Bacteroidota bacterium]
METVVLQGNSKADLKILTDLAKKIGITVKYLSEEEKEDIGLLQAVKEGRTGKYISAEDYLQKLRK